MPRKAARLPSWESIFALGASANSSERKDALTQAEAPVRELLRVRGFRVGESLQVTLLEFADAGYLEMEQYVALKRMLDLRNDWVHKGKEASAEEVTEKLERAAAVCETLASTPRRRAPLPRSDPADPGRQPVRSDKKGARPGEPISVSPPPLGAFITSLSEELDVVDANGQTGLQIQIGFHTMDPVANGAVAAFFYEDNAPLRDLDGQYRSPSGEVAAGRRFTMPDSAHDVNLALFIPYAQLHLPPGQHSLNYHVIILRTGGERGLTLGRSVDRHFTVTVGPFVAIRRLSENLGARDESGQLGLEVRVDLLAAGMQGVPCCLVARFSKPNEIPLHDRDGQYCDMLGEVATSITFTPAFASAEFTNLSLFLPYTQLHLGRGRHDLAYRIVITRSEGEKNPTLIRTASRPFTAEVPL